MQWYYQQRLGENGLGIFKDTSCHFDLGWGEEGLFEVQQDLFDLRTRAQQLEEELRELRRAQLRLSRAGPAITGAVGGGVVKGVEGVKKIGRKVLGVGGKVQAILPIPRHEFFHALGHGFRKERPSVDEEAHPDLELDEILDDDTEIGNEIIRRRKEIEDELAHVREQQEILQRIEVGTAPNVDADEGSHKEV
jgi:hypothetical protein